MKNIDTKFLSETETGNNQNKITKVENEIRLKKKKRKGGNLAM